MSDRPEYLSDENIKKVDAEYENPLQRGERIWKLIEPLLQEKKTEVSQWDIICFCISYLQTMVSYAPHLKPSVMELSKLVFHTHYLHIHELDQKTRNVIQPEPSRIIKSPTLLRPNLKLIK